MLNILKQKFRKTCNSKGQGTIEYILMLVVVVFVVFGLLYQFNSAFGKFAQNYFGDYLACLLEYGELPNLGGNATTGECDSQFQEFDIASGKNPLGPGFGQGNNGSNGDAGKGNANKNKSKNQAGNDSSAAGSGSFGAGATSRSSNRRSVVRGGNKGGNGDGDNGIDDSLFGGPAHPITESENRVSILRPRVLVLSELSDSAKKKAVEKKAVVAKETENLLRPPRLQLKERALRKTAGFEESETNIGFGGFIRFLFITGIVIALIILLGGQALQISKEWD